MASTGVTVGRATLELVPELVKLKPSEVTRQLAPTATAAGETMATEVGKSGTAASKRFSTSMTAGVKSGRFSQLGKSIGMSLIGGFAAVGVAGYIKGAIDNASDLNETMSKANNVFGKASAQVQAWSKTAATSFGLSRQEALAAASTFGDMFSQLGFGKKQAAATSEQIVKMAADLGSFHNVDPSDVLDRIGGALRGEYDSLQQLIPNINAARVQQEALNETHKKSAKSLTAAEKATAVLAIIQKDGKNAANDFAETSGQAANQQRIAAARSKDLSAQLGQNLLPAYTKMLQITNKVVAKLVSFSDWIKDNKKQIKLALLVISPLIAALTTYHLTVGIVTKATKAWEAAQGLLNATMALNPIGLVIAAVVGLGLALFVAWKKSETFRKIVTGAFGAVKHAALVVWDWIKKNWPLLIGMLAGPVGVGIAYIATHFDKIKGIVSGAKDTIKNVWGGIVDVIKKPLRTVFNFLNQHVIGPLNGVLGHLPGNLKLPEFPKFARGGVVRGPGGPRDDGILAWVSNGETVIPAHLTPKYAPALAADGVPGMSAYAGKSAPGFKWGVIGKIAGGISSAYHSTVDWGKEILDKGARWVIDHTVKPLLDQVKKLVPGDNIVSALVKGGMDRLLDALERKGDKTPAQPAGKPQGPLGGAVRAIESVMALSGVPALVTSAFRPGSSGSYHSTGNAVDFGWYGNSPGELTKIARFWDQFGPFLLEEIYSGDGGHFVKNGRRVGWGFYGAATEAEHYNHVHIAATKDAASQILGMLGGAIFDSGGLLKPGQVGVNLSGRPEAVLDPDETVALKRGLGGRHELLHVEHMYVNDDVDLDLVLQRQAWRERMGTFG